MTSRTQSAEFAILWFVCIVALVVAGAIAYHQVGEIMKVPTQCISEVGPVSLDPSGNPVGDTTPKEICS
jgi:hypothetical protein